MYNINYKKVVEMVKHNLKESYFHGCGDCRDCCNGKLFSMGEVNISDFKTIIKIFPTAINIKTRKFVFFYSLIPYIGCHYLRDNQCTLYNIMDRPNTCLNYPFGIDRTHTIQADQEHCPNLNNDENDFPVLINNEINPKVMNDFFTEKQYINNLDNQDKIIDEFIKLAIDSNSLLDFPKFKTTNGEIVDINEIETNRDMKIINVENIRKVLDRQNSKVFDILIDGHILSLENLPQFGKRLLEQI